MAGTPDALARKVFKGWQTMEQVDDLDQQQLDELPFGAIQLDPDGQILAYNEAEARLSGRRPEQVIGRNFFTEVAPCTNVREFAGRFRQGVAQGDLNEVFPYLFDFKMQPTQVWVRLFYSETTDSAWVFVSRREDD
ncbi:MAG: photoactive yellow protein [Acidobacteriota bacterium]